MLPPGDLELNRGLLEDSLPDSCALSGMSAGTSDGMGGWIGGTAVSGGTVPCRVSPTQLQPDELQFAGQIGEVQVYVITLPAHTNVDRSQQITATITETGDVSAYEVIAPRGPRSVEISRRVIAVKVS